MSRDAAIGLQWSLPFIVSTLVSGIAFGVVARGAGLHAGQTGLFSGIAFSGTAQLAAVQMWVTPLPIGALIVAAAAINGRYLAMGATLRGELEGYSGAARYSALAFLTDAGWALSLRARKQGLDAYVVLLVTGLAMWIAWVLGSLGGAAFGGLVPDRFALLVHIAAICLLAVLIPDLVKGARDIGAIGLAIAATAVLEQLGAGSWASLCGGLAGAALATIRRR